jgi:hypothetical protein
MRNKIERTRWGGVGLALVLSLGARPTVAQPPDGSSDWVVGDVHGFASQGFLLTTGNDYLVEDSTDGSFQLSEVGINYSRQLTDKLRFGLQLFAQNFGPAGNYTPQVDWFYLDYRWRDWLGLRAGRLKLPYGVFNEVHDIDSARVPVLLPQSVYPQQARTFLFAYTGGELYGFARSRVAGAIEYRLYGGTVHIDPRLVVPVGTPVQLTFNVPYAFGGRLTWETPLPGLRLGGTYLQLHLDSQVFVPMMAAPLAIENDSYTWLASLEYAFRAFTMVAEYGRGHSDQRSVIPGNTLEVTGDGGYVMFSYVVAPWFQPALYYSLKFNDVNVRDGLENKQHDVSLTLRFDINRFWLVKLEGHYMAGTAGLVNPLRFGPPPANPERHWGVFLIKTTASF